MERKPVILLNIDSLMSQPLEMAIQTGRAPALQFLMEQGTYLPRVVSSFPTMSVTIDSSLLTGTYADQHGIPGLHWFHVPTKEMINYGTGFRETFRIGMRRSIHNMLDRLNHEHLSHDVTTIYEDLASKGLSSASINSFVYRGHTPHRLRIPRLFQPLSPFKGGEWIANGPPTLSLGEFSKISPWNLTFQIAAGNYKFVARELRYLIRKNKLPAFTFCIFQDLDFRIHFKGPMDLKGISRIDKQIQKILNMYHSWEEALRRNVWLVMGDNGHAPTRRKYSEAVIDLRKIFKKKYRIAKIQRPIQQKDELVFSVNQRMAYIYLLNQKIAIDPIVEHLKQDERIDVIAWKEEKGIRVESGLKDGSLYFHPGGDTPDVYGQIWTTKGHLDIVDVEIKQDGTIMYGDFPDAFARLYGALHAQPGRFLVVNAKPGHEFKAQSTPFHLAGAAHGSLHKQESLIPLIIAGTAEQPTSPRIVDLKEFILRIV